MNPRTIVRDVARRLLRTQDVTSTLRKKRLAVKKLFYRRPFSLDDVRALLSKHGFARGRVVWVQSSWNEFYNLAAKPSDVLSMMLDMLGPAGSLVMPAFPAPQDRSVVLEIDRVASSSGLLTEIFRRQKGVLRSIHLTSSVCALGPAADYLVRDHHHDIFPWGPQSPFLRLVDVDARLVCLGLGRFVSNLTPLHAVECLLYDEVPFFRQVFEGTMVYRWRRASGEEGVHEFRRRVGRIKLARYGRHFPKASYEECRISNLETYSIDAKTALTHALALARAGITIYAEPKPRAELFNSVSRKRL